MGLRSFIHRLTAPKSSDSVPNGSFKLVLVINHDLKMGKGKIAAQSGHASVSATLKMGASKPNLLDAWLTSGQKKVCVKTTQDELLKLEQDAIKLGIQTVRVNDAGKTQIPSGSLTVIALGPAQDDELTQLTGHLKLL